MTDDLEVQRRIAAAIDAHASGDRIRTIVRKGATITSRHAGQRDDGQHVTEYTVALDHESYTLVIATARCVPPISWSGGIIR